MRIALLAAAESVHTLRWANALSQRGHEVQLISMSSPLPGFCDSIRIDQLPISAPLGYWFNARRVRKLLTDGCPDLLHAHYAAGYGVLGRLANFHPYILSVWGSDVFDIPYRSKWHHRQIVKNLSSADQICSTSQVMAERAKDIAPALEKIEVIPFGVDLQRFDVSRVQSETITIGTVKTLIHTYGIDILIRAFAICREIVAANSLDLPAKLRLKIAGDGSQRNELQILANSLQLAEVIDFSGAIPHKDVPNTLANFDIFVAASRRESFGVAVVEASASRLPIVATNVGGLPEVVSNGRTGIVVPCENPQALGEALAKLCLNPELRRKYGNAGRQYVAEQFDWSENVSHMEEVYLRVLQEAQSTSVVESACFRSKTAPSKRTKTMEFYL